MLLPEYQGKELLRSVGLPVPEGALVEADTAFDSVSALPALDYPIALKAQVASGGRGKRGGVIRVDQPVEMIAGLRALFEMSFDDETPEAVLAEPWLNIERELYLSVTVDAAAEGYVVLYSPKGGVDVEGGPDAIRYPFVLPWRFRPYEFRELLLEVETDTRLAERIVGLAHRLVRLAAAQDCTTVEINPLACTEDGSLIALDAKVVCDEWAAYRNKSTGDAIKAVRAREPKLLQNSLNMNHMYVRLDGDIGLISGGAGLTMAVMDMIQEHGGKPACFLDCSPGPTSSRGYRPAFAMLDADPAIRVILVSIFGGGTQMQRVATAMREILAERTSSKPVVFRLNGTNVDEANRILSEIGIRNHETLEDAVQEAVKLTRVVQ